jgi:hypothetical protein
MMLPAGAGHLANPLGQLEVWHRLHAGTVNVPDIRLCIHSLTLADRGPPADLSTDAPDRPALCYSRPRPAVYPSCPSNCQDMQLQVWYVCDTCRTRAMDQRPETPDAISAAPRKNTGSTPSRSKGPACLSTRYHTSSPVTTCRKGRIHWTKMPAEAQGVSRLLASSCISGVGARFKSKLGLQSAH